MGTALVNAGKLASKLDNFNWEILDAVGRLTDDRRAEAAEVDHLVREALSADEQAVALDPALKEAQSRAVRVLTQVPGERRGFSPPVIFPSIREVTPRRSPVLHQGEKANLTLAEAQRELDLLEKEAQAGKVVTVSLAWQVVEKGGEA